MSRVYLASSWRNSYFNKIVDTLRDVGHDVFNFRSPRPGNVGFHWKEIDEKWQDWSTLEYREVLETNTIVANGYLSDLRGMQWADTCVLLLPCGRSAHLEAGWFAGANKRLIIYMPEVQEPDLMYLMANHIVVNVDELIKIV